MAQEVTEGKYFLVYIDPVVLAFTWPVRTREEGSFDYLSYHYYLYYPITTIFIFFYHYYLYYPITAIFLICVTAV